MKSTAPTVETYLAELPGDRRVALAAVRDVIVENLPFGFEEGMQYGIIGFYVPLERYPETYKGEALALAALASQKRHMALYPIGVYGDAAEDSWFRTRWESTGKRLDMGKTRVGFRRLEDVPLDVVGETIARSSADDFIAAHERSRG